MNIDHIRPENYQRAFFFKGIGYLLCYVVLDHYRKRNFLSIYQNGIYGTYIENGAAQWAGENGKKIFSDKKNFAQFENDFRQIIAECETYIKSGKEKTEVTIKDLYDLQGILTKTYYYFEKTEFFFTDTCYKTEMSELLKKNLLILGDDLKFKSRPLFVELFTTILYGYAELAAKKNGLDKEDVKFYNFDEFMALVESGDVVEPKVISERKTSYVVYCENQTIIPLVGKEKEMILERFKDTDHSQTREFKGVIANKGKVTAKALVIIPEMDQDYNVFVKKLYSMEMNTGDILVTETTSPDFVPLMKKAGGIIANQGGLNSHAAIMSRELKVPCLVGTYHATEILKTGDLIELDANTGVVRVLSR